VTAQLEVAGIFRATGSPGSYPLPDNVVWSLLDLAIYLELAGQTEASHADQPSHRRAAGRPGK
jgi:hypothetical protein